MIYQSSLTQKLYELTLTTKRTICPECSHNRRKSKEKCVSWDIANNRGFCQHCNASFFLYEQKKSQKEYKVPEWKNITDLTDKAVKFFEGRAINQETLRSFGVYSDVEYMPQFEKKVDVICFPFFKNKVQVNIKYRGPNKSFKLVPKAEILFYNYDVVKANKSVIITEGEIDALSFGQSGHDNAVSVPNGAGNSNFLDDYIEDFKDVKEIYLAVDNDKKGIELREELSRRFGHERILLVDFKDCKDANEYLIKYGALELFDTIKNAKNYPIKGVIAVNDIYSNIKKLFDNGLQKGETIEFPDIDNLISWELGRLAVVTGIPGHGKSEMVDFVVSRLNYINGWKAAYFSPENFPLEFHFAKVYEKLIGKKFSHLDSTPEEFNMAYEYIRDNYYYIMDEEDYSVDMLLNAAKSLVKSKGIKMLVIDPYNKLEHNLQRGENETTYISRFLDKIITFAKINRVLLFLVAHPKKMQKGQDGLYIIPSLYDISGSANFFNKADYGLTIYREYDQIEQSYGNQIQLHVQKVKFKHLGKTGMAGLTYNYKNGRFEKMNTPFDTWDNNNYLVNAADISGGEIIPDGSFDNNDNPF